MVSLLTPAWASMNTAFEIAPGEIHVWSADLDLSATDLSECRALLSPEEVARADRLLRAEDRLHFSAARCLLRRLLGWYLQVPPQQIAFSYESGGKPFLSGDFSRPKPRFNLSHSRETALFTFAIDRELGIDVEQIREDVDGAAIVRRYFHPNEIAFLAETPEPRRLREFFRLWTRKEAWLKAKGQGMSDLGSSDQDDKRFRIVELDLGDNRAAALAYEGDEARLRLFRWA